MSITELENNINVAITQLLFLLNDYFEHFNQGKGNVSFVLDGSNEKLDIKILVKEKNKNAN